MAIAMESTKSNPGRCVCAFAKNVGSADAAFLEDIFILTLKNYVFVFAKCAVATRQQMLVVLRKRCNGLATQVRIELRDTGLMRENERPVQRVSELENMLPDTGHM